VPWVAKQIAELRGMTSEQIAEITSKNFDILFKKNS
jgi:Tat protein secretion system quality control protein TatD with DNase activity